jgi:BlaI family penicillinase repressor
MPRTSLTKLELQIMETFWSRGPCSVREIQESFPESSRPAYTTIQTTVFRMETNGALRCVKWIANAKIFEAAVPRTEVGTRMWDDLLAFFGGGAKPVMNHLIEAGRLTLDDVREAEQALRKAARRKNK